MTMLDHAESERTEAPDPTTRRGFLSGRWGDLAAAGAVVGLVASCKVVASPFDRSMHLQRRLTYGPTEATKADVSAAGPAAWVAAQLDHTTIDTSAVDAKVATLPAIALSIAELNSTYPNNSGAVSASAQLKLASLIRATESPAQLYERMVEFWSDHLNVPTDGRLLSLLKVVEDREIIRPHAMGRFKDLLVASASSPAMLLYLDNAFSTVGGINENYARELLELHTIGVDGGYSETDVVETARLLTGWGIDRNTGLFQFSANRHDKGPVSILGWSRPAGTNYFGHGVQFLHWLAERPEAATFICTKIARRFVADVPTPGLVAAMQAAWLNNDTQVVPVLAAMVAHPDFDQAAEGKFQRPLDFFSTYLRAIGGTLNATTNIAQLRQLGTRLDALGQVPFTWPAPNGYPDVEGAWLNTGALLNRWNLVGDTLAGSFSVVDFDPGPFAASLNGLTAAEIYETASQRLTARSITPGGALLLDNFTGWSPDDLPSSGQINEVLPLIAFTLIVAPDAMYR